MQTRKLGNLEVSALGLGCMGMSFSYATKLSTPEGVALIHADGDPETFTADNCPTDVDKQ
ncbi:MAG TPA: hypothetical protein PKH69_08355 [Thiobacillaceae bacterium]|nr:hypothetical protein [Thiobacillaceae bacterium]HNU64619.1 hypothetical protein [Thiobacillaceae bacterium]